MHLAWSREVWGVRSEVCGASCEVGIATEPHVQWDSKALTFRLRHQRYFSSASADSTEMVQRRLELSVDHAIALGKADTESSQDHCLSHMPHV